MFNFLKPKPSEVFFIRGYAKSGTNWLCNLMNLHPDVMCRGEFHFAPLFKGFTGMQEAHTGILKKQMYHHVFEEKFHRLIKDMIIEVCGRALVCGDRTPAPLRDLVIPDTKTLYISRDGRDAMVSWTYHSMNRDIEKHPEMKNKALQLRADPEHFENHKRELLSCESSVRAFAKRWNATVVDDFRMMQEADRGEVSLQYHWIRYEDLHQNTDGRREAAYRFLDLDPTKAAPLSDHTQAGFGDAATNRPTDFFRRGQAGAWQEYFTDEQLAWFETEAREALEIVSQPHG